MQLVGSWNSEAKCQDDHTTTTPKLLSCCSCSFSCFVQAGLCRWPASSSFSGVGWRTRSTWRTCWTTSVTSESRYSCCSSLKAQTSPVRRKQCNIHTFQPHRFQSLFSEADTQQHLSRTFALMLLRKYHFQMLKHDRILQGTPRQSFLKNALIFPSVQ